MSALSLHREGNYKENMKKLTATLYASFQIDWSGTLFNATLEANSLESLFLQTDSLRDSYCNKFDLDYLGSNEGLMDAVIVFDVREVSGWVGGIPSDFQDLFMQALSSTLNANNPGDAFQEDYPLQIEGTRFDAGEVEVVWDRYDSALPLESFYVRVERLIHAVMLMAHSDRFCVTDVDSDEELGVISRRITFLTSHGLLPDNRSNRIPVSALATIYDSIS